MPPVPLLRWQETADAGFQILAIHPTNQPTKARTEDDCVFLSVTKSTWFCVSCSCIRDCSERRARDIFWMYRAQGIDWVKSS